MIYLNQSNKSKNVIAEYNLIRLWTFVMNTHTCALFRLAKDSIYLMQLLLFLLLIAYFVIFVYQSKERERQQSLLYYYYYYTSSPSTVYTGVDALFSVFGGSSRFSLNNQMPSIPAPTTSPAQRLKFYYLIMCCHQLVLLRLVSLHIK